MKCTPQKTMYSAFGPRRRLARELERVARDVRELDDLVALVVVAQDEDAVAKRGLCRAGAFHQPGVRRGGQATGAIDSSFRVRIGALSKQHECGRTRLHEGIAHLSIVPRGPRQTCGVRVVMTVEAWPDEGGGFIPASVAAALASKAWAAGLSKAQAPTDGAPTDGAPTDGLHGADVVALAMGDGGPRTADVVEGPRRVVGQAVAVECAAGILLAPRDSLRWNPHRLASALYDLAREVPDGTRPPTVIVPLGDVAPAGDAIDVWGPSLEAARDALSRLAVIALVGSSRPLLGFHGMAAATMAGRESDIALAAAAQEQERRWAEIAAQVEAAGFAMAGEYAEADGVGAAGPGAAGEQTPGVRGAHLGTARIADLPGSGAAGGLAYCLAAAGARLASGATFAASLAGLDDLSPPPDLVVAICRDLTPRGLDHGSVVPASAAAARLGVPCVAIAPAVRVGKRDLMASGISGAYPAEPGAAALADRVRRVAHTWTPRA